MNVQDLLACRSIEGLTRIEAGLEGRWTETAVPLWTREEGLVAGSTAALRDARHAPALEFQLADGWVGVPCHREVRGVLEFDAERARQLVRQVLERVHPALPAAAEVRLVPFAEEHFDALIGWTVTADFLQQWAGSSLRFPLDRRQLAAHREAALAEGSGRLLFTALSMSDEVVGHGELGLIEPEHGSARLHRLIVDPARRGKGLGQALVAALCRYGFDVLGLERLDLQVFAYNAVAVRCYERAGFRVEGRLSAARIVGGRRRDLLLMARLAEPPDRGGGSAPGPALSRPSRGTS